ncbi:MAG TPA: GGDEF domain-containing protein [Thermoanaerobaculia bacterium]|nr:GGDEF domain-containing protein [Thermoanaerobaculia bacterium]
MKRKDSDTRDPSTDGLSSTQVRQLREKLHTDQATVADWARQVGQETYFEAAVILIAHPENKRLGTRFTLAPGSTLDIGRSPSARVSLPEVPSLSRSHARLRYDRGQVMIEDLGSRNGTYVNDREVKSVVELHTGDRFQVGSVHFKFLHERDVEHAYHEAIYQMVMRDGLTEIFNQRKFQEEGARELARAQRHARPLSLILFDIDHFKQVNDTYGHLCGDAVLKQLSARVGELLRPEQIFARVGGEEFAVLSPETDLAGALTMADKIREIFAARHFDCGSAPVRVTCSFGVAVAQAGMRGLDDLVSAADRALYRAKNGGRNRVEQEPVAVG